MSYLGFGIEEEPSHRHHQARGHEDETNFSTKVCRVWVDLFYTGKIP